MTEKTKIVIVGGGFAGIKTALELRDNDNFDVTLVSPRSRFEYHGAMYRSATGKSPLEVVVPFGEIFSDDSTVHVAFDSVVEILPASRQVKGESGNYYHYDKLVMCIGNVVNYFGIPGMDENSETIYTIDDTIQLRNRLVDAFKNAHDHKTVDVTIVGAGPTGVEVASDILSFADIIASKYDIKNLKVRPRLIEAGVRILRGLSEEASSIAAQRLNDIGVDVVTGVKVLEATPEGIVTDNAMYASDVNIWTAGTELNPLMRNYGDLFPTAADHRVSVNEYFQSNDPAIYVIGDAASTQYSGMAQTAIHHAIWLANNVKLEVSGGVPLPYAPKRPDYVVPIGDKWAILESGGVVTTGIEGWNARRKADRWVLENFLPYDIADKHVRYGDQLAQQFSQEEIDIKATLKGMIKSYVRGEVSMSTEDLDYYSTDGSIFQIRPSAIVFPKDSVDVQALVRAVNDMRKTGIEMSIVARGNGTDQGGGPIGEGIIVDFTRHMDQILETGSSYVVVQPGCNYQHLQNELNRLGRYLPPYPASIGVCTIGGAVANNSAGEKTIKYGATRDYIEAVQIVLADGTATWVYPMDEAALHDKKQLDTLEGSIYRQISDMIEDYASIIYTDHPNVTKESAGYALWKIRSGGMFDLPQIIVGSQGTLGIITSIRLRTMPLPDPNKVSLLVSFYDDIRAVSTASSCIRKLMPSALEIVDSNLLSLVAKQQPTLLKDLLPKGALPKFVLLTEFDDQDDEVRHRNETDASDIVRDHATSWVIKYDTTERMSYWKLRRSAAAVMWTIPGAVKALPIIEDGTVPPERLNDFLTEAYNIFDKYKLTIAIWGHAGDANLHMQPFMDLSDSADRNKIFALADEYYAMIQKLGGTAAGEHNDSLMRAPYRHLMFSPLMEELFVKVKEIFDKDYIFNPNKKIGVSIEYLKSHMRNEYSIKSIDRLNLDEAKHDLDN
jgi:NADH dehydrogenase FAD-containing subunit/FAD/FMN-containing dehydrogenase